MKTKKHDVLVLNKSYIPIHIITWQKSMSLIIQESARPLDRDFITYTFEDWLTFSCMADDYQKVPTVRYNIAIPEVIVLRDYNSLPVREVKYSRQTLFQRDKFRCAYCNETFAKEQLTIDHIIPRSKGGLSNWSNTVSCCRPCNYLKADKTPEDAGLKLLIKPKKPIWLSPIADIKRNYVCKSWLKFMDRPLIDIA